MRREIIIAIVFGVLLGLIVAVVMVLRVRQIGENNRIFGGNQVTPPVRSKTTELQPLEISSPSPDSITSTDEITIKGKALKESLIVILSATKELVVKNDKENFSISFQLNLGENNISITAYPKDSKLNPQTNKLKVYYLTE